MIETRSVQIRVFTSHVGYKPELEKFGIVQPPLAAGMKFRVKQIGWTRGPKDLGSRVALEGELAESPSDWGPATVADCSFIREPGIYQIEVGRREGRSVPFIVGDDVYARTMRLAFDFFYPQRCGVAVPGYHAVCHLDDGVARDDDTVLDVVGGWHDAGDLWNWLSSGLLAEYALLELETRLAPRWNRYGSPWGDVLDELRWENDFALKMQDPATGCVWHGAGSGEPDNQNSDMRWTDNLPGSGDERHVDRTIHPCIQWQFIAVQARTARAFSALDPAYARRCAEAAARCWQGWVERPPAAAPPAAAGGGRQDTTPDADDIVTLSWACIAALEVSRMGGWEQEAARARELARELMRRQSREYEHGQTDTRGFFYADADRSLPLKDHFASALPIIALARLLETHPDLGEADAWRNALKLYLEEYALPLSERTPYRIVPYGLYVNPPVGKGRARPLAGGLCYRYFKWRETPSLEQAPQLEEAFEHGGTSHLLDQAVGLALTGRALQEPRARQLAYRQLEWVMGANPYASCLMTGGGVNSPFPYSLGVGLIVGGIMNGFIGGEVDEPFLDMSCEYNGNDWNTTEYWLPHNAHYLWALALLEQDQDLMV